jgi:hypothetical protein
VTGNGTTSPTIDRQFKDFRGIDLRDLVLHDHLGKRGTTGASFVEPATSSVAAEASSVATVSAVSSVASVAAVTTAQGSSATAFVTAGLSSAGSTLASTPGASPTKSSTTSPTFSPINSAAATSLTSSHHGGLSSSAKIGLGVGIPLGIILIGALLGVAYFFGKKKAKADGLGVEEGNEEQVHEVDEPVWGGAELETKANVVEMDAGEVKTVQRAELYGN